MDQPTRFPVVKDAGHHQDTDEDGAWARKGVQCPPQHVQALTRGGLSVSNEQNQQGEDGPDPAAGSEQVRHTSHQPHRTTHTLAHWQRVRSTPG